MGKIARTEYVFKMLQLREAKEGRLETYYIYDDSLSDEGDKVNGHFKTYSL